MEPSASEAVKRSGKEPSASEAVKRSGKEPSASEAVKRSGEKLVAAVRLAIGAQLAANLDRRPGRHALAVALDKYLELEDFVSWMRRTLDNAVIGHVSRLKQIFLTTLRYEYLFWEMAYRGEAWPE